MKYLFRIIFSILLFAAGWLFNFVIDIQFALGVAAGWLMKEGFNQLASILVKLGQGYENIVKLFLDLFQ